MHEWRDKREYLSHTNCCQNLAGWTDQAMNCLIGCTSNNHSTLMVVIIHRTILVKATCGYADRKGTK